MLRKAEIALDETSALADLDTVLAPLQRVQSSVGLYRRALALPTRCKLSFSDSMIVAAALEAGCKRLSPKTRSTASTLNHCGSRTRSASGARNRRGLRVQRDIPSSRIASPMACTACCISLRPIAPMQPTRKVSTCVSLPGYRMKPRCFAAA